MFFIKHKFLFVKSELYYICMYVVCIVLMSKLCISDVVFMIT